MNFGRNWLYFSSQNLPNKFLQNQLEFIKNTVWFLICWCPFQIIKKRISVHLSEPNYFFHPWSHWKLLIKKKIKPFKNWCYQKMSITKNVLLNYNSWMKKKIDKDSDNFWHRKLTLKVKFWHFLTPSHNTNFQNSIFSFWYVDS